MIDKKMFCAVIEMHMDTQTNNNRKSILEEHLVM